MINGTGFVPSGVTVKIYEGQTLTLAVQADDKDTAEWPSQQPKVTKAADVSDYTKWEADNNATLNQSTGASVTVTPPAVPQGQTTVEFTVKAKADDGGARPLVDDPDNGQEDSITVRVYKNGVDCPQGLERVTTCTAPTNWDTYFDGVPKYTDPNDDTKVYFIVGYGETQARYRATPVDSNNPAKWNGTLVYEEVTNGAGSTADPTKFYDGQTLADTCKGGSTWVLSTTSVPVNAEWGDGGALDCTGTLGDLPSSFKDIYAQLGVNTLGTNPKLKPNNQGVVYNCTQKYFCRSTAAAQPTKLLEHTIRRTYNNFTTTGNRLRTKIEVSFP